MRGLIHLLSLVLLISTFAAHPADALTRIAQTPPPTPEVGGPSPSVGGSTVVTPGGTKEPQEVAPAQPETPPAEQPAEPGTSIITIPKEQEATKTEVSPVKTNTVDSPESGYVHNGNIEAVISLLDLAYEKYADEGGWVNVSYAGDFIKRSMPDFDSRSFGFSKLTGLIASLRKSYEMKKYKGKGTTNIYVYRKKKSTV
jgi:hypothetical protein